MSNPLENFLNLLSGKNNNVSIPDSGNFLEKFESVKDKIPLAPIPKEKIITEELTNKTLSANNHLNNSLTFANNEMILENPESSEAPNSQITSPSSFCSKCGNKIVAEIKFCGNCGNKLY